MKNIFRLFAGVALIASLTACSKDFLETTPTDSYSQDVVFATADNIEAALNGLHKSLVAPYFSRQNIGGLPSMQIAMDAMGEDLVFPVKGNGWWTNTGEVTWSAPRNPDAYLPYYFFNLPYKWISNANMIIDNLENAQAPQARLDMLKGQALAYRAYCYHWLVQIFADKYNSSTASTALAVPLVISTEELVKAPATVADVYTQIEKDAEEAIKLLEGNEYTSYSSLTDITAATAMGIRARIALTKEDWTNAKLYADKVIKSGAVSLMSQAQYQEGFNDASNPEWMWGFEMIADQTLYFYGYMAFMSWNFNSTNIRACPKCINKNLYEQIPETDVRKGLFDPTGKAWKLPTSSYVGKPYMNRKFAVKDYTSSVSDQNYMRLAEMYLIAAEAAAKSSDNASAQQYLYDLNKTRDTGYTKSTKTGADLLEEIYLYRRIELWGEGHRFLDLKRLGLDLDRTNSNHDAAVSVVMTLPASDPKWKFCYPTEEIEANPLIPSNIND